MVRQVVVALLMGAAVGCHSASGPPGVFTISARYVVVIVFPVLCTIRSTVTGTGVMNGSNTTAARPKHHRCLRG